MEDCERRNRDGSAVVQRLSTVGAVVAGVAYLSWRLTATMGTGPWWLAGPFLVIEVWAFVLLVGLLYRAWPRPVSRRESDLGAGSATPVDVVVTAGAASFEQVERSLIALAGLEGPVTVIEGRDRPEVRSLCDDFGAAYRTDGGTTGAESFLTAARHDTAAVVLWLDGGEVPLPGLLAAARARFVDLDVAVVQIGRQLQNGDSLVNVARGGDPELIDDTIFGPRMGAAGAAPWIGSGSFVRRDALDAVEAAPSAEPAVLRRIALRLHRNGWRTEHIERPLIGVEAPRSLDAYLGYRRRQALASYRFLCGRDGPIRARGVATRHRCLHLAEVVGHTGGLRLLALSGLVIAVLMAGRLPVEGSLLEFMSWWFPAWLLAGEARRQATGGILRRGDVTRHAWRGVDAELSALATLVMRPGRGSAYRHRTSLSTLRAPLAALIGINGALLLRAVTLLHDGALPSFSATARVVALGVAVASIAMLMDVLQLTARRKHRRRSHRVPLDRPVRLDGLDGRTLDITADGIGIVGVDAEVGQVRRVTLTLPVADGLGEIAVDGVVRAVTETPDGTRVGLEFTGLGQQGRRDLVEFCLAEGGRRRAADQPVVSAADLQPAPPLHQLVRTFSLVGVAAGLSVLMAGPAAASTTPMTSGSICVVDSVGGPVADVEAKFYHQSWVTLGVTSTTGCVEGLIPEGSDVRFGVSHRGLWAEERQDTRVDGAVVFSTVPVVVSLVDSGGGGLSGGVVEFYSGGWERLGVTDVDGRVVAELLPTVTSFGVSHRGLSSALRQDTGVDTAVGFQAGAVRSLDDRVVSYFAGGWRPFYDGIELLPAPAYFELDDGNTVRRTAIPGSTIHLPSDPQGP